MAALTRNRFVEEMLPILVQKAAGAAASAPAAGASKSKCPTDTATAQRMAEFAQDSYNDADTHKIADAQRLKTYNDPDSGFFAATYRDQRTGNIVLAYRGTEGPDRKDWWANVKQALGFETAQYDKAAEVAQAVQQDHPNEHIVVTGHSLGGGLAAVGGAVLNAPTTTFNAAGVNPATLARMGLDGSNLNSLVTNYRVEGEVLTGFQKHPSAYVGAVGGVIGALVGGAGGAVRGAEIGADIGSGIPAAAGCQVDMEARHPNGEPLSGNPITRHLMESVNDALQYHRQQEITGGCW